MHLDCVSPVCCIFRSVLEEHLPKDGFSDVPQYLPRWVCMLA